MDLIIEILLELILEGTVEISSNKKVPKWIRYPLIFLIILVFTIIIVGIFVLGMLLSKDNLIIGILFILLSLFFAIMGTKKFKEKYIEHKDN